MKREEIKKHLHECFDKADREYNLEFKKEDINNMNVVNHLKVLSFYNGYKTGIQEALLSILHSN